MTRCLQVAAAPWLPGWHGGCPGDNTGYRTPLERALSPLQVFCSSGLTVRVGLTLHGVRKAQTLRPRGLRPSPFHAHRRRHRHSFTRSGAALANPAGGEASARVVDRVTASPTLRLRTLVTPRRGSRRGDNREPGATPGRPRRCVREGDAATDDRGVCGSGWRCRPAVFRSHCSGRREAAGVRRPTAGRPWRHGSRESEDLPVVSRST